MKPIRFLLAAILTIVCGFGCGDKKPAEPAQQPSPNNPAPGGVAKPGPADFTLTSEEFAEEYYKDKAAFAAKYKDKTIELMGTAMEVGGIVIGKETFIHLDGKPNNDVSQLFGRSICFTSNNRPWNFVTPGQTVKVRGRQLNPAALALHECTVIEATGDGAPVVSVDDLAKEYEANDDATSKKWKGKAVIVTGRFSKASDGEYGKKYYFETPSKRSFRIYLRLDSEIAIAAQLKPGQEVRILATDPFYTKDDGVSIGDGLFLDKP